MRRLYIISLGHRVWHTTNRDAANVFTHSFGFAGFNLRWETRDTPVIEGIQPQQ
jgi:hypothetical protein